MVEEGLIGVGDGDGDGGSGSGGWWVVVVEGVGDRGGKRGQSDAALEWMLALPYGSISTQAHSTDTKREAEPDHTRKREETGFP